ncbi:hypothetical protein ALQ18_03861 [Pseudomonas marginalis pv. marginalis]|nr:hypothetical protein ALQ18_03861 [Pseudomonas marginalis pv. marginalis]
MSAFLSMVFFSMESVTAMLTDTKLRNLKPKEKLYKVNDRDGLYVAVTAACSISFRYNYSINGRQETITFGRYGVGGVTLAEARERLGEAKKMVSACKSPAKEKARAKVRTKWAERLMRVLRHGCVGVGADAELTLLSRFHLPSLAPSGSFIVCSRFFAGLEIGRSCVGNWVNLGAASTRWVLRAQFARYCGGNPA